MPDRSRLVLLALAVAVGTLAAGWIVHSQFRPATHGFSVVLDTGLPRALAAVATILLAGHFVGSKLLGECSALATALGLSLFAMLVGILVHYSCNYGLLYWTLLLPCALLSLRGLHRPSFRPAYLLLALPLAPILAAALAPETGADALAMHLPIAARVAAQHFWSFDVTLFNWAVMPMGGDWTFTLAYLMGGEIAAKLLNSACLLLLAALVTRSAPLLAAVWLATPLVCFITGSLFVENVWTLFLTASIVAAGRFAEARERKWLYAAGWLAGMAVFCKLGALLFAVPLLLLLLYYRGWLPLSLFATAAAMPYVEAWRRTGNPVFPFFNHIFKSPFFDATQPFIDARWRTPLSWTTPWDVTFHSSRFLEARDGAFGVTLLLFLPLGLLALRRGAPLLQRLALATALAGGALMFSTQSYLRYLYPVLPLLLLAAPEIRGRIATAVALCFLALNLALLSDLGPPREPKLIASRHNYLLQHAPVRLLIDGLNARDPDAPAAWLDGNAVADYRGPVFTSSWHHAKFQQSLRLPHHEDDLYDDLRRFRIDYVFARDPNSVQGPSLIYTGLLLSRFATPVAAAADWGLWRLTGPTWREEENSPAPPGEYDELNPHIRYFGAWTRDLQFPQPFRGSLVYAEQTHAWCVFLFRGSAVTLLFTRASNRGQAELTLDEVPIGTLDQYSATTQWRSRHRIAARSPGDHLLRVEVIKGYIDLDGFVVE